MRIVVPLGTALLLATASSAAQAPARIVARFGGSGSPTTEFIRVSSVLRLGDGRLVVANGNPQQVSVHAPDGRRLSLLGRTGNGPGEYTYGVSLRPANGDSVALFSSGTRRWAMYATGGQLGREWPGANGDYSVLAGWSLVGSALVRHGIVGSAGCSADLVRRLAPASREAMHEAMTDGNGRVWLREHGTETWTVYRPDGALLARPVLPARFRAMQFEGKLLIGVAEDDDGFDQVVVLDPGLPATRPVRSTPCHEVPVAVPAVRAAHIKTAMRNAMTAAESYYADHGRYPASFDDYPGRSALRVPGTEFAVLRGDARGFSIAITDATGPYRCIVQVGSGNDLDGRLICGS